ncbi:hypothetical protein BBP40_005852 [Aspergillus hancockii]|nr:hypothetical protein BBP40_005852 [Aspergillus hancockii]
MSDLIDRAEGRDSPVLSPSSSSSGASTPKPYASLKPMHGWRLWTTITALFLALLLSTLETTIVSTALVSIGSQLGDYDRANWIVVSYLLTYTGFLIIYARCSDIFGRKTSFLAALITFTVFSLACAGAKTMNQLICFRALQGVGGAGIYSMVMCVMVEITPFKMIGPVSGVMSSIFAMSSILGPVIGGAITSNTSWRWVFWLNAPGGGIAIALAVWIFPVNDGPLPINWLSFKRLDWLGIILSLSGSVFVLVALEQGGIAYPWGSPFIIICFVISGFSWIGFGVWETYLTSKREQWSILPVFPVWLARRRVLCAALAAAFLTGFPFMMFVVFLPQRFQIQERLSPVTSGIRMLPMLLLSSFGAGCGGIINSKKNVSFYTLLTAITLQIIGLGLMATLPASGSLPAAQYGFQAILGLGFGLSLTSLVIISRMEVDGQDLVTQVRVLGGTMGISCGQVLINKYIRGNLPGVLSSSELSGLMQSLSMISRLRPQQQAVVSQTYGYAFNDQTKLVLCFAAAAWAVSWGAYRRHAKGLGEEGALPGQVVEEGRRGAAKLSVFEGTGIWCDALKSLQETIRDELEGRGLPPLAEIDSRGRFA